MRNTANPLYMLMLAVGDFLTLLSAFVISFLVRVNIDSRPLIAQITSEQYVEVFLVILPFWIIIFAALGLYKKEVYEQKLQETVRLLIGSFVGILLVIGYEFTSQTTVFPARLVAIYGLIGSFALLFLERTVQRILRKYLYRYGIGVQNMMIIGSTKATKTLINILANPKTSGYQIKAIVGQKTILPRDFKGIHYSDLGEALKAIKRLNVNTIIQTQFFEDARKNQQILRTAQENHIAYRFIPTQDELFTGNHSVELFHGFPVVAVHQTRLLGWQRVVKRGFDVGMAILALPLTAFFAVIFGLLIKIEDPKGPIFYKSRRVTRFGTKFWAYKFRSMYWQHCQVKGKSDEEALCEMGRNDLAEKVVRGDMQIADDPRVTKVGRLMRFTSIDELPQFWNVLKGEMSVVGPRAITPKDMRLYKEQSNLLLYVKTGLTGLAQVSGRSDISYEERAKLNLYYVQNWSFMLDLRIILRTVWVILTQRNSR